MNLSYEWQVGWRYLRAGRGVRGNRFVSFIAAVAMLGIALGVAALIVVLSVMNGFQREVRERMLGVVAHVEIVERHELSLPKADELAEALRKQPGVLGVAPFLAMPAMLGRGEKLRGALVRGIDPVREAEVLPLARELRDTVLKRLEPGSRRIVLGAELARELAVSEGGSVTLVQPGATASAAPRFTAYTVVGTFDSGHHEYDSSLALVHLQDAATQFGLPGPAGLQVRLADLDAAPQAAADLAAVLGSHVEVRDWTRSNRIWFESVRLQKRMMALILTLIVAVAAFNLVSTLVMTVTDKRSDIAILRTLGASPRSVMGIFMAQGAASGLVGTAGGVALGLGVALNIDVIVPALERLLGTRFLDRSIYLIDRMPSDPRVGDVLPIAAISLALAFVATLYPSWRASRLAPAEALRHD
ncbi:lipoprotein-releasing ABC transporter permease subunit [Ideonella sp. A 288]|uniref:lipoprotein-releasing ABC transporter permease subunit n=1 Tax=Ideonella sp. A 288 TaxID=1962181 RepID=UPI000B4B4970|nr:lipoprotein-releasing ABC transporter permease subunit [Ideonella sp. A 288]